MSALPYASALTIGRFEEALDPHALSCDLRPLTFIDAYGLVGTACALQVALEDDPNLPIYAPTNAGTGEHLAAMGFRGFLRSVGCSLNLPDNPAFDASSVVVPLQSTSDSAGAQALSHLLWAQLQAKVDPQVLEAIAESVWEMVGNALEHSGSEALIMGQVYRANRGGGSLDHADRVQIVIGDVGRGVRGSFVATGVREPASDLDAINLALEYLVSSVADDPGRGQGLYTTMEQVLALEGRMIVRSGAARVSIEANGKCQEAVEPLPGVVVALSFPLYPG